jgi:hypothetical protein
MVLVLTLPVLLVVGGLSPAAAVAPIIGSCLGEYQHCGSTGECTLFTCGGPGPHCKSGQYRCPITNHCVQGVEGLLECPGLAGGHLDHNLGTEERVTKLIAATNLTEQIAQLTNKAPSIEHLGIPEYNWLSDDEHGVRGWQSTYFPDGPGLGASFDKQLLYEVGEVVGLEARAKHSYLTHTTGMRDNAFNGDGITLYGPNMNLVKDPVGQQRAVFTLVDDICSTTDHRDPARAALGQGARGVLRRPLPHQRTHCRLRDWDPGLQLQRHAEEQTVHAGGRVLQTVSRLRSRCRCVPPTVCRKGR